MSAESSTGCEIFRELGCLVWWGWSSQPSEGDPMRGLTTDCHQDISEKRLFGRRLPHHNLCKSVKLLIWAMISHIHEIKEVGTRSSRL